MLYTSLIFLLISIYIFFGFPNFQGLLICLQMQLSFLTFHLRYFVAYSHTLLYHVLYYDCITHTFITTRCANRESPYSIFLF